ncbi:D-isomer specific 2-hydroxyacid dehydrogenase [Gymnopus androsaceus JB14]|uniref:D-isomer specific 2-hydroxyacid dehydrogenase n=1 Tax=Gymnopus androsaceus JB14 TaxID=1447944 RepID=A0A6A4IGJ0_9AGAR|nr:D-isomer specific 2-hydroxyacid dehydrogenase [Gymnopus androsaceus JB14]
MVVRVAILDDYQRVALTIADWSSVASQLQIDVFTDTLTDEESLAKRLEPYEIICAMRERTKFFPSLLDQLPNLRLIATTGASNRGIDVGYAKEKGILVSGTGGAGNPMAEAIWALILGVTRYLVTEHMNVRAGNPQWQTVVPMGLSGATLGLIGVGRLGSLTAKARWSSNLTPERAAEAGVEFIASKEELLEQSDIVSLHLVLSERSKHTIGAAELDLMKPTAFLINTSRGPLIDESALVEVLKNKKIAGAGLDVFDQEPLPLDHPLRTMDNVTISPHNGYVNDTNYKVFWGETVENIRAYLDGKPRALM